MVSEEVMKKYLLFICLLCFAVCGFAIEYTWSEFSDGRKFRVAENFVFLDEDGNDVSLEIAWKRGSPVIKFNAEELTRLFETNTATDFWIVSEGKLDGTPCPISEQKLQVTGVVCGIFEQDGYRSYILQGHRENHFVVFTSINGDWFENDYDIGVEVTLKGRGHSSNKYDINWFSPAFHYTITHQN